MKVLTVVFLFLLMPLYGNIKTLRSSALAGDEAAQVELGNAYFFGGNNEIPKDYALAVTWYKKAAKQGNKSASFNVGLCYDQGYGVEKDYKQALKYYLIAQDDSMPQVYQNIAIIYQDLGKIDYAKRFYEMATKFELPKSFRRLGTIHLAEKKYSKAFKMFKEAVRLKDSKSLVYLSDCYALGQGVELNSSEALKWLKIGAKLKDRASLEKIAFAYQTGFGVEVNLVLAQRYYNEAVKLNSKLAMIELGKILLNQQKIVEAEKLFKLADNINAKFYLGVIEFQRKAFNSAFLKFEEAAKKGHSQAQYNTGHCFENGVGIGRSENMAAYWYEKAALQNNQDAMIAIAEFYYLGIGCEKNLEKSQAFLKKAVTLGNIEAKELLEELFIKKENNHE